MTNGSLPLSAILHPIAARRGWIWVLLLSLLYAGCATSHQVRGEELSGFHGSAAEVCYGQRVTVTTASGQTSGTLIAVRDSTGVLELVPLVGAFSRGETWSIPLSEIESLGLPNRENEGAFVAVLGLLVVAIWGLGHLFVGLGAVGD